MWWLISLLIILGAFLLIAELVLFPGITIAGIAALGSYCGASYIAYINYGVSGVLISVALIIIISIISTWLSLRSKTWQKLAQKQNIDGKSQESPRGTVNIGEHGVTLTRLAPSGKVIIGGETYEARTLTQFLDPQTEIEVTGFENFTVIVKQIKQ